MRALGVGTTAPFAGNNFVRTQLTALGITPGPNNRDLGLGAYNFNKTRSTGGQLSVDYDLGGATLTSVSAYRNVRQSSNLEADGTPLAVYDNNFGTLRGRQISQELRVASSGRRTLDYVAGIFYNNQRLDATNTQFGTFGFVPFGSPTLLSGVGGAVDFQVDNDSYAAFAQGTLHVGPSLRLIAGARYTHDVVKNTTGVTAIPGVCSFAFAFTGGRVCQTTTLPLSRSASRDEDGFSARAGVEYELTETSNVYFTYSRGYKGPAISSLNANVFQVEPETVDAFELGLKADLLDRRLNVNLAAFRNKFHDFQAQVFDPAVLPNGAFRTGNAGGLRTQGVEAELLARPATGFTITGGVTYLDAEYTNYFPPCYPGQTAAQGCSLRGPTFNAAGFPLAGSSKWSTSLAAAYGYGDFGKR